MFPGRTDGSICSSQKGPTWKLGCLKTEKDKDTTGFHILVISSRGPVMKTGKEREEMMESVGEGP